MTDTPLHHFREERVVLARTHPASAPQGDTDWLKEEAIDWLHDIPRASDELFSPNCV